MKTVLLAISLFSTQPATEISDTQWFDQQAMRDHFVSYLVDDKESVRAGLAATLSKGYDCSTQVVQFLVQQRSQHVPTRNVVYGMRTVEQSDAQHSQHSAVQ